MRTLSRLSALLFGATAVVLGCSERTATGLDARLPAVLASVNKAADGPASRKAVKSGAQATGLLHCTDETYASDTLTVGPGGGELDAGPAELVIPPGALTGTVTIILEALEDTVRAVRLLPQGLVFQQPVSLVMSYDSCQTFGNKAAKRVAYLSDAFVVLEYVPSSDDQQLKQVVGQLSHFSNYAIAW
jgi:hypothetical protein